MSTNYVDTLSQGDRALYLRELRNFPDPYCAGVNWEQNPKEWPPVSYFDIVNYFVFSTNYYTLEQTKAFRSLDAYLYVNKVVKFRLIAFQQNSNSCFSNK